MLPIDEDSVVDSDSAIDEDEDLSRVEDRFIHQKFNLQTPQSHLFWQFQEFRSYYHSFFFDHSNQANN
jgi:hypothetical protein